ncbi:MAG: acetate uptake transporter family protein [Stellaceae bacterium]
MLRPGRDKGLATPLPLGLAGLATTIFLMGIAIIFQPPTAWMPYLVQALLFGGMIELLAGMWSFAYGDPLAATVFTFLGGFFVWWGVMHMSALLAVHGAASAATANSIATIYIVTGVVMLYLWVASFYEGAAFNHALLFLWLALGLTGIAMFTGITVLAILGGIAAIVCGLIAAYTSFAEIFNATALQETIPLGESMVVRTRVEEDELERLRRLHAVERPTRETAMRA